MEPSIDSERVIESRVTATDRGPVVRDEDDGVALAGAAVAPGAAVSRWTIAADPGCATPGAASVPVSVFGATTAGGVITPHAVVRLSASKPPLSISVHPREVLIIRAIR